MATEKKKTKATKKRIAKRAATKSTARKKTTTTQRVARAKPVATKRKVVTKKTGSERTSGKFVPHEIEKKWQARWENDRLWHPDLSDTSRQKYYFLTMYPYPSGDLHIGHWYAMAPSDAGARYRRMRGYNVFFPMGFDAFGLPAENAAIKRNIHPYKWTMDNIANMRKQLRTMGASFDWEREVVTCDPRYYKWNQWFFIQMFKRGLAYKKMAAVDWCPKDQTVLAREQVVGENRVCERCGTPVVKRDLEQWFLKITAYADELLDFGKMDWPERVRTLQTNWIGRSEGVQFTMRVADRAEAFDVFTTRHDTVYGMTFAVLAPEHHLVEQITTPDQRDAVNAYVARTRRESEIERLSTDKVRDGEFTGAYAINPMNGERVPIWIADYVLTTYGTGAIMGVPAHDERDFDFALRNGLPILPVIERPDGKTKSFVLGGTMNAGFAEALRADKIPFDEKQGSLYVTIPNDKIDQYIALAKNFLRTDSWNEVVGTRWLFIFHDGVMEWDSLDAERKIIARCHALEPDVRGKRSVMEMLHAVEFYRDVLFHHEYGTMIHSGEFSGTPAAVARERVADAMEQRGIGKRAVHYRLRDWLISRQRFWGAPIPIVYCPDHGAQTVPENELPVVLPLEGIEFMPTGESPLTRNEEFLNAKCPVCGKPARRETDTMDGFVDNSWYYYDYLDPYNTAQPIHREFVKRWMPLDQYTGGIEHATGHLLYTRFWTKMMRDIGLVEFDEPITRLFNQGDVVAWTYTDHEGKYVKPIAVVERDGHFYQSETNEELTRTLERMSKSKQNGVAPDELVKVFGADAVRLYLMFQGPWNEGFTFKWEPSKDWDRTAINGMARWLNRVWSLATEPARHREKIAPATDEQTNALRRAVHQTIKRVTEDIEAFKYNTAIAALMELTNTLSRAKESAWYPDAAWGEAIRSLLLMIAPLAPHIAEEMWARLGGTYSIHHQAWPPFDPNVAREEMFTLVVQVNGKVRAKVELPVGANEEQAKTAALREENVQRHLDGKTPQQVIYVAGRLVNIVV